MKKNNSFTLLELIIAIVILGILAAIAIPTYRNTVEKTKGNACVLYMRTILTAWPIYNDKNAIDYAIAAGWYSQDNINSTLRTQIIENDFGQDAAHPGEFYMQYFPQTDPPDSNNLPRYEITTNRITDPAQTITCTYYPNGHIVDANTYYYMWSGTWNWLPDPANE